MVRRWWRRHTYRDREGFLCFRPWWLAPIWAALCAAPVYAYIWWALSVGK